MIENKAGAVTASVDQIDRSSSTSSLAEKGNQVLATVETQSSLRDFSAEEITYLLKKLGYESPEDVSSVPPEIDYVGGFIAKLSLEESIQIIKNAVVEFSDDPNIPSEEYAEFERLSDVEPKSLVSSSEIFEAKALAALVEYHSPYKEVRATVDPFDDPDVPIETVRSYVLALIWAIVGSGFNEFFAHRLIPISLSTSAIQMLLFPCGRFWSRFVPKVGIPIWKGKKLYLNIDSPWTAKEQMFATLLFAICMGTFYTHYNILTLKMYYNDDVDFGYQFWLSMGVQYMGLGFAGILRKYVVYPTRAIWPSSLQTMALNKALFSKSKEAEGKGITGQTFFFWSVLFMFFYTWIPTYLMNFLSVFNWMTWIAPENFNLGMITGSVGGLGINPISSFDWNTINMYSPLLTPFFSYFLQLAGAFLAALIVIALYWSNYYDCQYLPIFSNGLFTNTGKRFKITKILNSDYKLDNEKYQAYSPPYFSAGNILGYGSFIAVYPLLIIYQFMTESHILLDAFKTWISGTLSLFKKETWKNWSSESHELDQFNDAHSRMMKKYKEVPEWWYFCVFLASLIIGICVIEKYHTSTPVWSLFMSIGFNFVFLIPLTILQAVTGTSLGLNVLIEMIMGYALPGNPQALMIIKAFGYNIDGQADNYVSNLKLGHYAKIAPIALFRGQLIMVFVQVFVNLGVLNWSISNLKDYCQPNQAAHFTCPDAITYYNSSVMWGAMGPKKIFNDVYPIMKWCWLIGACLGLFFGVWKKYLKRYYPKWFNPVLVTIGMIGMSPPYNLSYFIPGAFVNFFSQYYCKKYHVRLWSKFNYVLSAGFATGLVFSSIVIFFAVQYNNYDLNWWGNTVPYAGIDSAAPALKNVTLTPNGYFGPGPGHYP
ncbi:LAME_0G00716g1_1 [Lachancea meyersii CBS 8951]|uniref:LAME_0G00716g1_1 n=1 Tax=Lachancea meyersii CBS 8951 TaxID=1266667 RepID=A0A1G4K4Z8_9SACH|nr:LAME_0G00716g1_1 [Lachancea meyersii CBS 8951]